MWIILSPFLYLSFKSFIDTNSSRFIVFQCILHDSGVLFSESWNFYKLKRGDVISEGNQFYRKSELFSPPFYIPILDTDLSSFNRYQCILHDSGVFFSEPWNFFKLNRGHLISGWDHFCRISWLFGPPLLYFNFESFMDTISSSFISFQWYLHDLGVLF